MPGGFPLYSQMHMSVRAPDSVRFSDRQQLLEKVN